MEKFVVDTDSCIGCGACCAISSEFIFNDEGLVESKGTDISSMSEDERTSANNAQEGCPVGAITKEEA